MTSAPSDLVPPPALGRLFRGRVRVRLGDVTPRGRVRLDALARYAQDVAGDDAADAAVVGEGAAWVVRRTAIVVRRFPSYGESVALTTWCSGTGSRWAERRTSMTTTTHGSVDMVSTWVLVDVVSGRPVRLPDRFHEVYGPAAGGREVKARLTHPGPPDGPGRPWPIRFADFDVLGHVNNAAYWVVVEEELARRRDLRAPLRAEVEFRDGIDPDDAVDLRVTDGDDGGLSVWLVAGGTVVASAAVRPLRSTP